MICLACACVSCTAFGSTGDARPNGPLRGSSDELAPVRTPMPQLARPAHRNHRSPPRRFSGFASRPSRAPIPQPGSSQPYT
eukprot:10541945-Alexandrium_andersonii.AAC.1